MSTPHQRGNAGLGWVTLDHGVVYSRAWLTTNTPALFAAWERAQTQQQRQRLAAEIQQVAAAIESADKPDPRQDYITVRVQWAETTRYEAELDPPGTTGLDVRRGFLGERWLDRSRVARTERVADSTGSTHVRFPLLSGTFSPRGHCAASRNACGRNEHPAMPSSSRSATIAAQSATRRSFGS